MTEPDSPSFHHVHHLLWECYARMIPLADELFADGELTLSLAGTLDMVSTWPGSTAAELSRRRPKTQQAISQLVAKLEKLGYVERRIGPGRGVGLYLTSAGKAAQADGNRREEQLELRLRELLGEETYAQLGEMLERANAHLDDQRRVSRHAAGTARAHDPPATLRTSPASTTSTTGRSRSRHPGEPNSFPT